MTTQQSRYPGYGIVYPQKSTTGLKVVRIFTDGAKKIRHADGSIEHLAPSATVMELIGGAFCYASGQVVNKKEDLMPLPPSMKDRALKWFELQRTIPQEAIVSEPETVKRAEPDGPWILSSDRPDILDLAEGQTKRPTSDREKEMWTKEPTALDQILGGLKELGSAVGLLTKAQVDQGERIALIEKGTPKQSDRLVMARKNQSEKMKQRWAEKRAIKEAAEKPTDAGTEVVIDGGHTPETNEDLQTV